MPLAFITSSTASISFAFCCCASDTSFSWALTVKPTSAISGFMLTVPVPVTLTVLLVS